MSELLQGPVQQWEASKTDKEVIDRLLVSENEVDKAYGEVYEAGCFVTEFAGPNEGSGIAAVGELDLVVEAEFRLDKELDPREFNVADCMLLGAYPGTGDSREERVRDGLRQALEARERRLEN